MLSDPSELKPFDCREEIGIVLPLGSKTEPCICTLGDVPENMLAIPVPAASAKLPGPVNVPDIFFHKK